MSVCARVISIMDILRHHKTDMDITLLRCSRSILTHHVDACPLCQVMHSGVLLSSLVRTRETIRIVDRRALTCH